MTIPADIDVNDYRKTEFPIDDIFIKRWSPRAMSGEEIAEDELMKLFEAARWAPSSLNEQPWRFIYARKNTAYWNMFYGFVSESNQRWCKTAGVLVVIASKNKLTKYDADNRTHSFSAGSAFENLALQGTLMDLVVHPFGGFDEAKAAKELGIPHEYFVDAMIAIGRPGNIEDLEERDRVREFPSDRKKLKEIVMEGKFRVE
jgi:nitroreductase